MLQSPRQISVEIPDEAYWKRLVKCQDACPVHTDARGYIRAIAAGQHELAYRIARGPNPLACICGRVCGAPCEAACRRASIDAPLAIRALKRFVADRFGPASLRGEPRSLIDSLADSPSSNSDLEELVQLLRAQSSGSLQTGGGRKIAIIGSGPAGLACAHDLALMEFSPIIFEMEPVPAGMLYLGIPEYRLPRDLIRAEVGVIESLGVEIRCGIEVGKDVSFADLRREYEAVVICVGAKRSAWLRLPGSDARGLLGGVDFLRAVALKKSVDLGERVVVVGGGNVAYDVGRTVLRQEQHDVSREAIRYGAREVHLCCLESLEEMPADDIEIIEGAQEGVIRHNSLGPVEFLKDETGRVNGVVFQKCLSVYDSQRRFAPVFDPSEKKTFQADTVILCVGQAPDLSFLDPQAEGLELDDRGWPRCDPETQATSAEGVFVAGDLAHGPKLLIHAVASGKQAARSVYKYLTDRKISFETTQKHIEIHCFSREKDYEIIPRTEIPILEVERRLIDPDAEVEIGYTDDLASREAARCLDCGVNTIFDSEKCVLCGGCADICPESCLRLVSVSHLVGDGTFQQLLSICFGPGEIKECSAIIKDETKCLRCALCAQRCPVGAITMERMTFDARWKELSV